MERTVRIGAWDVPVVTLGLAGLGLGAVVLLTAVIVGVGQQPAALPPPPGFGPPGGQPGGPSLPGCNRSVGSLITDGGGNRWVVDRQGRKELVTSQLEWALCGYSFYSPARCNVAGIPDGPHLDFPNLCCPGSDPTWLPGCSTV